MNSISCWEGERKAIVNGKKYIAGPFCWIICCYLFFEQFNRKKVSDAQVESLEAGRTFDPREGCRQPGVETQATPSLAWT